MRQASLKWCPVAPDTLLRSEPVRRTRLAQRELQEPLWKLFCKFPARKGLYATNEAKPKHDFEWHQSSKSKGQTCKVNDVKA